MSDHEADLVGDGQSVPVLSRKRPLEEAEGGDAADKLQECKDHEGGGLDEATLKQIRVDGLSKWATSKQVRGRLETTIGVRGIRRVKKFDHQDFAFVYFETIEARNEADIKIPGHVWKGVTLRTVQATALDPDRWSKQQAGGRAEAGAGTQAAGADKPLRSAADCVTPLRHLPYEEQLQRKRKSVLAALKKMPEEFRRASRGVEAAKRSSWELPWLAASTRSRFEGSPCHLPPVVPSPTTEGYRNKCEFTFGRGVEGEPQLGFQLGQVRVIGHVVGSPADCPNVSDEMKACVARVLAFVQGSSLPVYDKLTAVGFWRQLLVRQTFNNGGLPPALMLLVQVQASADGDLSALAEVERLVEFVQSEPLQPPVRMSIGVQTILGPGEATAGGAIRALVGDLNLEERLLELSLRISPAAFFQVNTVAAERLCLTLREECTLSPDTILLDVCCGTGTLGLSMARSVKRVIGIEMCEEAVEDARANAAINGLGNTMFHASKAELAIRQVLAELSPAELRSVVAIVDPPRNGLHADVLKCLRACLPLRRLLFVSCHVPGFVANAIALCRPSSNAFRGDPFVPTKLIPLDLFPHTDHCELVVVLERPPLGGGGQPTAAPALASPLTAPPAASPSAASAPAHRELNVAIKTEGGTQGLDTPMGVVVKEEGGVVKEEKGVVIKEEMVAVKQEEEGLIKEEEGVVKEEEEER